jgi:predicted ATP-grasp superfamily ATP-dependent carboligase
MVYSHPAKPRLRVLLSEGSSTSARQAITALGLAGHWVEICDPNRHCIGRFSRFVRRFHRCPGLGIDPEGYLAFILDLVSCRRFDVLLPVHEQGLLFAKTQQRLAPHAAVALPTFESYERVHSKTGFSEILSELGLPQPETAFITNLAELRKIDRFPFRVIQRTAPVRC